MVDRINLDPCKAGKCISYPICLTKSSLTCRLFSNYLSEYMAGVKITLKEHPDNRLESHRLLWDHLTPIFPNLKKVTYQGVWKGQWKGQ